MTTLPVYFADVSAMDSGTYQALYERSSLTRRAKADRFVFQKDKNLCIGAGTVLDAALQPLGFRESEMAYRLGLYGKPYFVNAPDIHFNISHSADKVMVCLSDTEVGCDIEQVVAADMDIAKNFLNPNEYDSIIRISDETARNEAFFRVWTLKESFIKANGRGLSLPLCNFEILLNRSPVSAVFRGQCSDYHFSEPASFPGFRCAVCSTVPAREISCKYVQLKEYQHIW